jgi:hypothetical protein
MKRPGPATIHDDSEPPREVPLWDPWGRWDINGLPVEADGVTVCPHCRAAWRIPERMASTLAARAAAAARQRGTEKAHTL